MPVETGSVVWSPNGKTSIPRRWLPSTQPRCLWHSIITLITTIKVWNIYYPLRRTRLVDRHTGWKKLPEFDFTVWYVNALSRLYEFDVPGTMRASTEYVEYNLLRTDTPGSSDTSPPAVLSAPVLVGQEAMATVPRHSDRLANKLVAQFGESMCCQSIRKPAEAYLLPGFHVVAQAVCPPCEGCTPHAVLPVQLDKF